METTRIISAGEDRTQQIGVGDATRQISPPGGSSPSAFDPNRTALGAPPVALAMQLLPGNPYALTTQSTREHALIQLTAGGALAGRRLPLNLCLVIDRSGSMEGEPLEYVKRACGHVVDLLEPNDVLSVVTFEEQVDVVMPARRVSAASSRGTPPTSTTELWPAHPRSPRCAPILT
jgi:Ca-activated chloride channel family protein